MPENDSCQEFCFDPKAVARAQEQRLSEEEVQPLAEVFKIMGDRTRLHILHALSQGELCVCDLALVLEMTSSAVSHQLRILRNARLVKYRREGKNTYYSLDDDHVTALFRQGLDHIRER